MKSKISKRSNSRFIAVDALYIAFLEDLDAKKSLAQAVKFAKSTSKDFSYNFSLFLVAGVLDNMKIISDEVEEFLVKGWSIDRISSLFKAILFLGVLEILKSKDTPIRVILNEYIEISKIYIGKAESSAINKILISIYDKINQKNNEQSQNIKDSNLSNKIAQ